MVLGGPELSDRRHRGEGAHPLVEGRAGPANNFYGGLSRSRRDRLRGRLRRHRGLASAAELNGGDSNSRRWGSNSGNAGWGDGGSRSRCRSAAEVAPHSPVTRRFFPIRGPIRATSQGF